VFPFRFLKPFGIVVGTIGGITWGFSRYAWAWSIFRGWYVDRPDLRGTWRVILHSDWVNPDTGRTIDSIPAYMVIRQTLIKLSVRLITAESTSRSIAYSLTKEQDDIYRLATVYRNEPKVSLQGVRSEIHHGAFWLEVLGQVPEKMQGHYWTDRKTKGEMFCTDRRPLNCNTFEMAEAEFSE